MRKLPNFGKRTNNEDSTNLVELIVIILLVYFLLNAFWREISGNGSKLDNFTCIVTPIGLIIWYVWHSRKKYQEHKKLEEERQQWKEACKSVEVVIANRDHSHGGTYEDGYHPGEYYTHRSYYRLDLELNADQRAVAPNRKVVRVNVSRKVYEVLQNRDTVRIYYKPEVPLTFLLEEEI